MGARNTPTSGERFYYGLFKGTFVRNVPMGTPDSVSRENKLGKTVHELRYNELYDMRITAIEKKVSEEYGASWEVTLTDIDETCILNLPYSGRITNGLLFRLPNINFSEPVTLKLFTNKEDKTFLTVYDKNGNKIEAAYSKEKPNGLPEAVQRKSDGIMKWNYDDQMDFIENMIENEIQPKLKANREFADTAFDDPFHPDNEPSFTPDSSIGDLPF